MLAKKTKTKQKSFFSLPQNDEKWSFLTTNNESFRNAQQGKGTAVSQRKQWNVKTQIHIPDAFMINPNSQS